MKDQYDWILFDADNTLLDFDASERYGLEQTFAGFGVAFEATFIPIYQEINAACWRAYEDNKITKTELREIRTSNFLKAIKTDLPVDEWSYAYMTHIGETGFLLEGAMQLLDLAKEGHRLALVTNGAKEVQRPRLRNAGIYEYFDVIVVSDEIGHSKPSRAFFEYCFAQMSPAEPAKSLIVGDNLNSDIRGGQEYGLDTCWYNHYKKENNSGIAPTYEVDKLATLQEWLVGE